MWLLFNGTANKVEYITLISSAFIENQLSVEKQQRL